MNISELMKFPKIRARLEKYLDTESRLTVICTEDMHKHSLLGFFLSDTEEGPEFWNDLSLKGFEDCVILYPNWFKDRELDYDPKDVAFTNIGESGTASDHSLLVKFLVNQVNNIHGHGTFSTKYKPTMDELVSLIKELDIHYSTRDYAHSVFCEIESDGSGSINVRNYYPDSKNNKDLLLMTFGDK
jgi:hypothetical protein